jgi:hypothetical protein
MIHRRVNRERNSIAASSKAVGGQDSDGIVGIFESLINVVSYNRPKMLTGLNQKVRSRLTHCSLELHGQKAAGGQEEPKPSMAVLPGILGGTWEPCISPTLIILRARSIGKLTVRKADGYAGLVKIQKRRPSCNGTDRGSKFAPRESGQTGE